MNHGGAGCVTVLDLLGGLNRRSKLQRALSEGYLIYARGGYSMQVIRRRSETGCQNSQIQVGQTR